MNDERIIALFFDRSEEAISATAEKYGAYCMTISKNILSNPLDSEENVNDTYMQLWRSIPPERPKILSAYIAKIARNLALNRIEAANTQKRGMGEFSISLDEMSECTPSNVSVENSAEVKELSRAISEFLRTEKEDARKMFVCRCFYADSISDIAQRFSCGESKVKSSLMRTRVRLKRYLEKGGYLFEE